jgi:hypothetical protein
MKILILTWHKGLTYKFKQIIKKKLNWKPIFPSFESFGLLGDSFEITSAHNYLSSQYLDSFDFIFWEWTWNIQYNKKIFNIRKKTSSKMVLFSSTLERWWKNVNYSYIHILLNNAKSSDIIAVMNRDNLNWYKTLLPNKEILHLPTPIDLKQYKQLINPSTKQKNLIFLTFPSLLNGEASRMPISTLLAFKHLCLNSTLELEGSCVVLKKQDKILLENLIKNLDLSNKIKVYTHFAKDDFFKFITKHYMAIYLPNVMVQGRMAITLSALRIPMVCSDIITAHKDIFPETATKWNDPITAGKLAKKLLEDDLFYLKTVNTASENIQKYSIESIRENFKELSKE